MKATKLPRPLRRARSYWFELTEEGGRSGLPTEAIPYEVTKRGRGAYLPTRGKFHKGEDSRRHRFTLLECSLGGHCAAFALLCHYADAYGCDDGEWEALAAERLNTILTLRAQRGMSLTA